MSRPLAMIAAGLTLLATPALAQTTEGPAPGPAAPACTSPSAPAVIDGATATMEQVLAAKAAVAAFIAASDTYQACLVDGVKAQRDAAKASKSRFDESIAKDVTAKINANQKDKETTGKAFNNAVKAYKAAHPA